MTRPIINPALLVILAGVSAALHVGKLPPALPVLQQALGISLLQSGFLLSMVQLAGMTLGLAVGLMADGLGLKRSVLIGLTLLGGAGALGGWAQSAAALIGLRALEGFGFLLVTLPAPSLLRQLVSAHGLNRMLGVWGTYMPLGAAIGLLLGPLVIAALSWQAWWWGTAALSGLMAVWFWRALPDGPPRRAQAHDAWAWRLRQTLRARGPWLVALSFTAYSGQWMAVIGFLPSIYAQAGISAATSAVLTALVAAANIGGNLIAGRLLQRGVAAPRLLKIGFCVMALGAFLAFTPWSLPGGGSLAAAVRFLALVLFSGVGGLVPATLFSLAVRLAPSNNTVSTTVGWMQQWSSLGQFSGPPLVAFVAVWVGGWSWTWLVTGVSSLLGLWLARQIGRQLQSGAA